MTDPHTMSELARVQRERDELHRMLRDILSLVDDSTRASLGPDAPLRAVKALVAERDVVRTEVERLRFYETTSAAEAIRMLHDARAEIDVLRQECRERETQANLLRAELAHARGQVEGMQIGAKLLIEQRDEARADCEAAEQRLVAVMDGTFSVGDGTAQREIERLRRFAEDFASTDKAALIAERDAAHRHGAATACLAAGLRKGCAVRLADLLPRVLPASWREIESHVIGCASFQSAFGLRVLVGVEDRGRDTGLWHHVSTSRANKLPSWADLREVKDLFFGRQASVVQLLPPEEHYVNLHPFVLHLWSRLDAPTVPPRLYEDQ